MPHATPPSPLCVGGTFNPPHLGHLLVARAVAEGERFSGVRLIVAGQPPHKPGDPQIAPAADRLAMCRLAVSGDAFFTVEDLEVRRGGPSYTLETGRALQADSAFAGRPIPWLIGADLLPALMSWHQPAALLAGDVVRFVVIRRPGHVIDWARLPRELRILQGDVVEAPQIDISASGIRRRIAGGLGIRYLVPETVREYIEEHGLYQK